MISTPISPSSMQNVYTMLLCTVGRDGRDMTLAWRAWPPHEQVPCACAVDKARHTQQSFTRLDNNNMPAMGVSDIQAQHDLVHLSYLSINTIVILQASSSSLITITAPTPQEPLRPAT